MTARLAHAYVCFLLMLEALLFTTSLLLNLSVYIGAKSADYGLMLFRGSVIALLAVTPFVKDGLRWMDQIKSCPKWMSRAALAASVYGLLTALQVIFPHGTSIEDEALTISGFPLGFHAISFCILYSDLRSGFLGKSEVARRALLSVIVVTAEVTAVLAYRAGYLHRSTSY